ncbi:unnamed protein product [Dicrocoelium dendriticum]|nr:unnamed protein product [Dicrocoelium dendriticum]
MKRLSVVDNHSLRRIARVWWQHHISNTDVRQRVHRTNIPSLQNVVLQTPHALVGPRTADAILSRSWASVICASQMRLKKVSRWTTIDAVKGYEKSSLKFSFS